MMKGYCMVRIEDGNINSVATKHGVLESRSCASKFFITYNGIGLNNHFNVVLARVIR